MEVMVETLDASLVAVEYSELPTLNVEIVVTIVVLGHPGLEYERKEVGEVEENGGVGLEDRSVVCIEVADVFGSKEETVVLITVDAEVDMDRLDREYTGVVPMAEVVPEPITLHLLTILAVFAGFSTKAGIAYATLLRAARMAQTAEMRMVTSDQACFSANCCLCFLEVGGALVLLLLTEAAQV